MKIKDPELWDAANEAISHLSSALQTEVEHIIRCHPDQIKEYCLHMETEATKAYQILAEIINSRMPG